MKHIEPKISQDVENRIILRNKNIVAKKDSQTSIKENRVAVIPTINVPKAIFIGNDNK
jgi:hypothetical protein